MTFGVVNLDYRAGRFHRKVDGLVGIIMAVVKMGYGTIDLLTVATRESLTEMQAQILICELEDAIEKLQQSNRGISGK